MLRRIDRLIIRVPHLAAAVKHYRDVLGLAVVREDKRLASLRFPDGQTELILHADPDLPAEATYYLVDDVRDAFKRRGELGLHFAQPPSAGARGYRAALKDPFGNVLLIVDRTGERDSGPSGAIEDAKPPGQLFAGAADDKVPVQRDALIKTYEEIGRTADDLPYTPDFEKLHAIYSARQRDAKPSRQETWRHLLNLRKGRKLPKLGLARSKPPPTSDEERQRLRELLGQAIGRRDRLPYSERFDRIVDEFNQGRPRPLSPHLVWRVVATLAK